MRQVLRYFRVQIYHRCHQITHDWILKASKSSCPLPKPCTRLSSSQFLPHIWLFVVMSMSQFWLLRGKEMIFSDRDEGFRVQLEWMSQNMYIVMLVDQFLSNRLFFFFFIYATKNFDILEGSYSKIRSVCVKHKLKKFLQRIFFLSLTGSIL